MFITVIDNSDEAGSLAYTRLKCFSSETLLTMSSTQEMVTKVLMKSIGKKIARLSIIDHGSPYHFTIGNDQFDVQKYKANSAWPKFFLLRGRFHDYGYVHLFNCKVGRSELLIKALAKALQVPVVAHTENYNGVMDTMNGKYVQAFPNGKVEEEKRKPTIFNQMTNLAQGKI